MIRINLLRCKCGCGSEKFGLQGWSRGHNRNGSTNSKEVRNKISRNRKGKGRRFGDSNPMFGKKPHNWNPDRENQFAKIRARKTYYGFVGKTLLKLGTKKNRKTIEELGYTPEEFRLHIESLFEENMGWHNHGVHGWHIDHVRPINTFPLGTPASEVNALTNLRPLWAKDNLRRPVNGRDEE